MIFSKGDGLAGGSVIFAKGDGLDRCSVIFTKGDGLDECSMIFAGLMTSIGVKTTGENQRQWG